MRHLLSLAASVLAPVLLSLAPLPSEDPPGNPAPSVAGPKGRLADQAALKPYAGLVGTWRGTGMVRRGSTKGAWTESASWAWDLRDDSASLVLTLDRGKYLKTARLRPSAEPGAFELAATLADGSTRVFRGRPGERGKLALDPSGPVEDGLARITLTPLHDTRYLLLLEAATPGDGPLARLGEVGYTREGVAFAAGDSHPVCIVTEGRGTIKVSYKGKDYWVCCSGCKDLFEEDPEAILAEAAGRKK